MNKPRPLTKAAPLPLVEIGPKALPNPPSTAQTLVDATGKIVAALELLDGEANRMRALAMASAAYGAEEDAEWFLRKAREPEARSPRCGRCGRPHRG